MIAPNYAAAVLTLRKLEGPDPDRSIHLDDLDPRRQRLWELQDFSHGRGLEIGPLHDPILRKHEADVRYIDILDQAGLRAYYQDHPGIPVENIPQIDYALTQPDGRIVSLVEASRSGVPFDWLVASHVVEHVPDLIGWLAELAEVVVDGGALVLVVPDRRYCFDVHRPPTTVGALLEANELGAVRPGVRAVYDHYSSVVRYDVADLWNGVVRDYGARHHTLDEALEKVELSRSGTYVDSHVWLFSPGSFVEQVHELRVIGRSTWYVDTVRTTQPNENEFMVRLRRVPRGSSVVTSFAGEVLPESQRPDWLEEHLRVRATLERRVLELEDKLARRNARLARLRARVSRQSRRLNERARELDALRRALPSERVRTTPEGKESLITRLRGRSFRGRSS